MAADILYSSSGRLQPHRRVFACPEREQAGVGRSPTLLTLRFATGVLRILRGYFAALLVVKRRFLEYLRVSCITGYLYNHIADYIDISRQFLTTNMYELCKTSIAGL